MARRRKADSVSPPRLYRYQRRWVEDESRFKIACKARQIGFTFAAAWRVVDKRLLEPGLTLWISASERQALEAMEHIRRFCRELKVAALCEEEFVEGLSVKQRVVRLPNGSRIIALPANPDTVRGFAGDVVLDEFAFHRDAEAIWRAAFATATRGFQIEIISTPNGTRGKYYELAKAAGLVDYMAIGDSRPATSENPREGTTLVVPKNTWREAPPRKGSGETPFGCPRAKPDAVRRAASTSSTSIFSPHWVDLAGARGQGFKVDVEALRAAIGDEDAWQQEYCCRFLSDAAHFLPPELVVAAESSAATLGFGLCGETQEGFPRTPSKEALRPASLNVSPEGLTRQETRGSSTGLPAAGATGLNAIGRACYLAVDIGRRRDLTVLWLLEEEKPEAPAESRRYVTRGVLSLERRPFAQQRATLDSLLAERTSRESPVASRASFLVHRCAIDASGLGAMLAEELAAKWGARVEPVVFTAPIKEALAVRVKRLLEERRLKIPYDPAIRAALGSVKRYVTAAGNVRFDAERTEQGGHADHFWALALALAAAEEPGLSVEFVSSAQPRSFALSAAF